MQTWNSTSDIKATCLHAHAGFTVSSFSARGYTNVGFLNYYCDSQVLLASMARVIPRSTDDVLGTEW
jgi:hypothetical protein